MAVAYPSDIRSPDLMTLFDGKPAQCLSGTSHPRSFFEMYGDFTFTIFDLECFADIRSKCSSKESLALKRRPIYFDWYGNPERKAGK